MNNAPPYFYNYMNSVEGCINPSTTHVSNTPLSRYFQRYLLQKAMSRFDFTLPESWAENYFMYTLFVRGFLTVFKTDIYGVIPQHCTLSGYNVFYQPSECLVANPLIDRTVELKIGANCELITLQPDYHGVMDIVVYHADLMALASVVMGTNLLNSRLSFVFGAKNQATAESFKKAVDKLYSGDTMIVVDKLLLENDGNPVWQYFNNDLKRNFITPELLDVLRNIELSFDRAVGIPTMNEQKKERQLVDEINSNNFETETLVLMWNRNIKGCIERVTSMFPELKNKLSVKLLNPNSGGGSYNAGENIRNGALQMG